MQRQLLVCEDGYSLVESLVAVLLMMIVSGAVFGLANPAAQSSQAQPEALDMQQRARVGADLLFRDLLMAGGGTDLGPAAGSLGRHFAAVVPRRMGLQNADAFSVARGDAVTIALVAATPSQTTLRDPFPHPSAAFAIDLPPNCPAAAPLCGFQVGMPILVHDSLGHFDFLTVTQVQSDTGFADPRQPGASHAYQPGAVITPAESHTYYFDASTRQLRHYDGYLTDVPILDDVVDLRFEYFGDPLPPAEPRPPAGQSNCLYDASGNYVAGLGILTADGGSLARLPLSTLADGPWCGHGANQFDADLLRVKKVRVHLRVQSTHAAFRGVGADYMLAGPNRSALRALADYSVCVDVSPRNLNLDR